MREGLAIEGEVEIELAVYHAHITIIDHFNKRLGAKVCVKS